LALKSKAPTSLNIIVIKFFSEQNMSVADVIKNRYSCRKYANKPIEKEKLDLIMDAARLAPSAKNLQDWRFVLATDEEGKKALATVARDHMFLAEAGAIIVACGVDDYVMSGGQRIGPIDISIALEHIALQATELGLATCWIGSYDDAKVRELLDIPKDAEIIELMGLGYPADEIREKKRMKNEEIFCFEKWAF